MSEAIEYDACCLSAFPKTYREADMRTQSFHHILQELLSFAFIISISGCDVGGILKAMPPAETPILETILDLDSKLLVPFHAFGVFEMPPNKRIELRLRAIEFSSIEVRIEGQALPKVTDNDSHPELDSSGYYRIYDVVPIAKNDPRAFWKVRVVLPDSKKGVNFEMTVHDFSLNPDLSGVEKAAPPLLIDFSRSGVGISRPSSVFWQSTDCPDYEHDGDCKHAKYDAPPDHDGAFIADNVTVAGWLLDTPGPCCDTAIEDIHYNIWLDNDFIERNYSPLTQPLNSAIMPGRWSTWLDDVFHPRVKIPITDGKQPNASTFLLPGNDSIMIELNAWHKSWHKNPVPAGWVVQPNIKYIDRETGQEKEMDFKGDIYWPFNVRNPSNPGLGEPDLQVGDYVIITGALVEDNAHLHVDDADLKDPNKLKETLRHLCWFHKYTGHGGWLEIHPVDSIRRVPAPMLHKHTQLVQACDDGQGETEYYDLGGIPIPISYRPVEGQGHVNYYLTPIRSDPPSASSVLAYREIIDDRFTDMSTVEQHTVEISPYEPAALHVEIKVRQYGHFSATYLLWWEEGDQLRPTSAPLPTDTTPPAHPTEIQNCVDLEITTICANPTPP